MPTLDPSRRAVLLAGLAGTGLALAPDAARAAPAGAGSVEDLVGEAHARLGRDRRRLAPAAAVYVGDEVTTGPAARLALRLGAATTVRLGAEARLVIDRFLGEAGGVLELGAGGLLFDRPDELPKTDIRLRSAYGLIAVRGTRFFAGPSRGVFGVFVERGRVAVEAGGESRALGPGLGVDIARPGARPGPVTAWSPERIAEALAGLR